MKYINPFVLFESIGQSDRHDGKSLRRAKKVLIQNFDLTEDGMLSFGEVSLHKSDVMPFLDELDDVRKHAFHICIYEHRVLCDFLMGTDTKVNGLPSKDEIESCESGIIEYISPYFAEVYGEALAETVKNGNTQYLKELLNSPLLVTDSLSETCYTATHRHLANVILNLVGIKNKLDSRCCNDGEDIVFVKLPKILAGMAKTDVLNCLPNYFQDQKNSIAETIRSIAVSLQKHEPSNALCLGVLKIADNISVDSMVKSRLKKDIAMAGSNVEGERQAKRQKYGNLVEPFSGCFFIIIAAIILAVLGGIVGTINESCSGKQTQTHVKPTKPIETRSFSYPIDSSIFDPSLNDSRNGKQTQARGKSKKSIETHNLSELIDSGKLKLSSMESGLTGLEDDIQNDERRLRSIKVTIDLFEARLESLSELEVGNYNAKVQEHNLIAKRYNSKLAQYEAQYRVYKSLLDSVNAMVSQYNSGRR